PLSSHRRCGLLAVGSTLIPLAVGVGRSGPVPSDPTSRQTAHPRPSSEPEAEGGPPTVDYEPSRRDDQDAPPSIRGRAHSTRPRKPDCGRRTPEFTLTPIGPGPVGLAGDVVARRVVPPTRRWLDKSSAKHLCSQ